MMNRSVSRSVTVIYDDRRTPPSDINAIIGATRFSGILRKRLSLGEEVRRSCVEGGATDLFHLIDERDAHHLAELIEDSQPNHAFLRLPSFLMPARPGGLPSAIDKGRYILQSMLLAPVFDDDAAALLTAPDAIALLRARGPANIRELAIGLAAERPTMLDHFGFVDLRRPEAFLAFMGDATEARHFNATARIGAVFRKTSSNRVKMAREYGFFHVVPERLKAFLLPTFDYAEDNERAGYSMERLNVPDAALQFIHFAFDERSFSTLVDRFFDFIRARPLREVGAAAVRERAERDILGKMNERLTECLASDGGRRLDRAREAAGPLGGLRAMGARADALVREAIKRDPSSALAIGHGDPCFSNILFDRRIGMFRLIDPRGARTLDEAWMHPLYDLAKFSHSAMGGYDFVNNDLFDCALDGELRLHLTLDNGGPPPWGQEILRERIEEEHSLFVVRAYELSLFMSMLPLHMDHPRKLAGFALIAARLILDLEAAR